MVYKMNKYLGYTLNIGYIIGFIISIEYKVVLWYILITTALMLIIYWKQLCHFWFIGAEWYADKCIDIGKKIRKSKP